MRRAKKFFLRTLLITGIIYILGCTYVYFFQESMLFFPQKLSKDYQFKFDQKFEEITIEVDDDIALNGLLFKTDSSKGLIFYLHGNAGCLDTWGNISQAYTDLGYDLFILDYRGYGKSDGKIESEEQFYSDIQKAYDVFKLRYDEENIIILGYSIGTASAAMLASLNNPRMLILQAPYYSMTDLVRSIYPLVPGFLLKYKFKTYDFLEKVSTPIYIFHGTNDEVIYYGSSLKLEKHFKLSDRLILLEDQGHNGMSDNGQYLKELTKILQ